MRKFFVVIALMFMCVSAPAYADKAADEKYIELIIKRIDENLNVTSEESDHRRAACIGMVDTGVKEACLWTWSMILNRRIAERSELETWLKAVRLEPKYNALRVMITGTIAPVDKYNATREETNRMSNAARDAFPVSKK